MTIPTTSAVGNQYAAISRFAALVLPDSPKLAGWINFQPNGRNQFYGSKEALVSAQLDFAGQGKPDIYIAIPGYVSNNNGKRSGENRDSCRALFIDIDAGPKKYAKHGEKVYRTAQDAWDAIQVALTSNSIHPPSYIIRSGAGFHLWYCLDQDIQPKEWDSLQGRLLSKLYDAGLKVDDNANKSTQLARLPGTLHGDTGRKVEFVFPRDGGTSKGVKVYKVDEINAWLGVTQQKAAGTIYGKPPVKVQDNANDALIAHCSAEGQEPIERVEDALRFVDPDCNYGQWRDFLWAILNALGDAPETLALADKWSSGALHSKEVKSYTSEHSIRTVFDSYDSSREGAITVGTLYHFAKLCGWQGYKNEVPDEVVHQKTDDASDLALSNVFVQNYKHEFKRDHSARKWRKFNGACWELCEKGEQVEAIKHCVAVILNMAAKELAKNQESTKGKKLLALAVRAQNEKGISAALKLAESDPAVAVTADQFDKDPDLFNTTNCVIHLPTGKVIPHDPAQMLSKQSPVAYDPSAQCPNFMRFMEQVSCNDPEWIDYQQRALGYMLSGRVHEEKMFFWFGDGRNGKSVLMNVLRYIFANYSVIAPAAMFMASRKDGGDATPHLAILQGMRLLAANETEAGARLSGQTLKVANSTEDISARHLHGNLFSFSPSHKTVMRGNHLPIIQEGDEGTWRRIDLVPFDLKLTPQQCDPDLQRKLIAEAPGILRWMVEGHQKWMANGLTPAPRVRNASLAYRKSSDVIQNWLDDECEVLPAYEVEKSTAYVRYRMWAANEGLRIMAKKSLTRSLVERGYGEGRQSSGQRKEVYRGFKCK